MAYDQPLTGPVIDRARDDHETDRLDHRLRGRFAKLMGGTSPWASFTAWADWAFHLSVSPGRREALNAKAFWSAQALVWQALAGREGAATAFRPEAPDRRFRHPGWSALPFCCYAQTQLALESLWQAATRDVPGLAADHARRVDFIGRFALNALAPVNFAWTNPEVVAAALRTNGGNFWDGARLYLEDLHHLFRGEQLEGLASFRVGETLATTPGTVIFRNALMELIQYAPTTAEVRREPILIVPAWIMKYYILDLTPADSLVKYLVDQGFTVFVVSWKNPGAEMRDVSFEDYRCKGVVAALDVVRTVVPGEKVHAVGYCLGGTVLAIAAAAFDRDGDKRLASLSLLAAQTDFEEAGELMLFIDDSQLALLEDMMDLQGYLDAKQMSATFYALRANELVFAKMVERYMLGKPAPPGDIDAWLTDATRMPARMHGEYLRQLFLENRFAHGSYQVDGRAVALSDIRTPVFALGAERDYIAPWRSVYKVQLYGSADTTFVLTGGGHNSSVVSPPGKAGAYYRVGRSKASAPYRDADVWLQSTVGQPGSWWPEWVAWLDRQARPGFTKPPAAGRPDGGVTPLGAAPGVYVLEN